MAARDLSELQKKLVPETYYFEGESADPVLLRGFTTVFNYFLHFWVPILGVGPAMLYLNLLMRCYGDRDYCFPSLNILCDELGVSKLTLLSYLEVLERHNLIKRFRPPTDLAQRKHLHNTYKVRIDIPLVPVDHLPRRLRKIHETLLKQAEKASKNSLPASAPGSLMKRHWLPDYESRFANKEGAHRELHHYVITELCNYIV